MDALQRELKLPIWQHVSLILIGSISLANIWHLYSTRHRTRKEPPSNNATRGKGRPVAKAKEAGHVARDGSGAAESAPPKRILAAEKGPEASSSDEEGEDSDSEGSYSSEITEVEEGELQEFTFSLEPFKQVLCVNTSLKKMDKGKAMAQCGHATLGAYRLSEKYVPVNVKHWFRSGQAKIVVKCTEEEMEAVAAHAKRLGVVSYTVEDAGRTQIPAGSKTVCAVGPAPQSVLDEISGGFKLM